ncbi:DUF1349 domain-containing protein [Halorhabdus amylolytica]|uniref:DUF1349 domain-containing protein n=1 Tax=Halorhabdus amylolytica TaxID=2559573 RepID=UPI0010AA2BBF|nr:DUF1349 domain-containing protein [Halorhabdus amylolytica]
MEWLNEPAEWQGDDDRLTVGVEPETDCWRVTAHDFVADDAHFYHRTVDGDFTATVTVTGGYAEQYDQAGLMVREEKSIWLKTGVEYVDGVQQASTVLTREFSDWSVSPLEDDPKSVSVRVERTGETVETSLSLDGESYTMLRQGYLTDAESLRVGMMAAAPTGDGFEVTFEDFTVE